MVGRSQLLDLLLDEDEAIDEARDEGQRNSAQGHLQESRSRRGQFHSPLPGQLVDLTFMPQKKWSEELTL